MVKEIVTYGDTETEKRKFHLDKNTIYLNDLSIDKLLTSNKTSIE